MSDPLITLTQETSIQTLASLDPLISLTLSPEIEVSPVVGVAVPTVAITLQSEVQIVR